MKLSEYIKVLQESYDEYGDLECYYASDEECNSYTQASVAKAVFYTNELSYRLENVFSDIEEYIDYEGFDETEGCESYDELFPIFIINQ